MANTVVPAAFVQAVVREIFCDKLINPAQGNFPIWGLFNGHGDKRNVRVRWLGEWLLIAEEDSCAMVI